LQSEALKLGWPYRGIDVRAFPQEKAKHLFTTKGIREIVGKKRNHEKLKIKAMQHAGSGLNWLHWEIIDLTHSRLSSSSFTCLCVWWIKWHLFHFASEICLNI